MPVSHLWILSEEYENWDFKMYTSALTAINWLTLCLLAQSAASLHRPVTAPGLVGKGLNHTITRSNTNKRQSVPATHLFTTNTQCIKHCMLLLLLSLESPQSRPHSHTPRKPPVEAALLKSPQLRPHWLLLIYSFQFRSAFHATPAHHRHCFRHGYLWSS